MRRNCFLNSPVKNYGVITVRRGATITNEDNFVGVKQPALRCGFIAFVNDDYVVTGCGRLATATKCSIGSTPLCFPGDATCDVQGKGEVMMRNLKLGDKVRVQGGKYEPVYSFGHHAPHMTNRYIKLVTSDRSLEVSKDHLVFVEGGRSVPASSIKVGDKLQLADGELVSVVAIALTSKQGAYAPFTASGTVVVNGVTTSSFVSLQGSENLTIGGIDTGLSYHFLSHAFEAPHRLWCQYVSACTKETYTPEGISLWAAAPHKWFRWYLVQYMITMVLLGVPVIFILLCIAHPATALVTIAAVLFGFRHHNLRCKRL
jgi:Hint module